MTESTRWVLVTGGTRGIGRALVERLAAEGYSIVFTYRDEDAARDVLNSVERAGGRARAYLCDLSKPEEVDGFAATCLEENGVPYGLVCSAGTTADGLTSQMEMDDVRKVFQVNLFASMQLVSKLARHMARMRTGRVVLISSVSSRLGNRGNSIYAATKGGIQAYIRSVIEEFARRGVTVNSVLPGFIDTEMTQGREGWQERILARVPTQRLGTVEDVAASVSFLLSEGASYINGAELVVDGGMSATLGLT